jgi:hypothetical protein
LEHLKWHCCPYSSYFRLISKLKIKHLPAISKVKYIFLLSSHDSFIHSFIHLRTQVKLINGSQYFKLSQKQQQQCPQCTYKIDTYIIIIVSYLIVLLRHTYLVSLLPFFIRSNFLKQKSRKLQFLIIFS